MKAYFVTVKLEPKWILENQVSGKSAVVDEIIGAIGKALLGDPVVVANKEFHQCRLLIATEQAVSEEKLDAALRGEIEALRDAAVHINIQEAEKDMVMSTLSRCSKNISDHDKEIFNAHFGLNLRESEKESEVAAFDKLIGLEPLRAWIDEVKAISDERFSAPIARANLMKNIAYLISINRGCGLSTILSLMVQTLKENGFFSSEDKTDFFEYKLAYSERDDDFRALAMLRDVIESAAKYGDGFKGIVAIDIEEWIDRLSDRRIDELLNYIMSKRNDIVFVFTVPFVENNILEKIYTRIDDVITTQVMKFVPPTDKQYFGFMQSLFAGYGIRVSDDAYNSFVRKITSEKNDGKFYAFNTVIKIVNEVLYRLIATAAKAGVDLPSEISDSHLADIYGYDDEVQLTGMEKLNGMVALNDVKEKVHEILSAVKLQRELYAHGKSAERPCFHMMFTGNPGTGKTVVARIIGRIFKEEGLLSVGNFFEVSRKDFIGKFVGHTAPKTMEICRNAYGSVLFVDEAYLLADENDSYSSEAIGTLIAEMENNRDKMIVIFAGYEKELEELFDINPGLRDRIPYKIHFPNYSRDELKAIFYMQLGGKMGYDKSFEDAVSKFFADFPDYVFNMRDFSNGRFVRNLAERIVSKAALRFEMSKLDITDFVLNASDFSVAVQDNDFQALFNKEKPVRKIGF